MTVSVTFTEEMMVPPDGSGVSLTDTAGNTFGVVSVAQGASLEELVYSGAWTPADPVPGVDFVSINYDAAAGDLQSLVGYDVGSFSASIPACGNATNLIATATGPTSITLDWVESLDDPTVTYELFRNGISIQTFAYGTDTYADSGLDPDTYYSYELHTLYLGNSIGSITAWTRTDVGVAVAASLSQQMFYSFDLQQTMTAPLNRALPEFNTARF